MKNYPTWMLLLNTFLWKNCALNDPLNLTCYHSSGKYVLFFVLYLLGNLRLAFKETKLLEMFVAYQLMSSLHSPFYNNIVGITSL